MSDFDLTITPPPDVDVVIEPPPAFDLQLGAQQGHQGIPGQPGADLTAITAASLNGHKVVAYQANGRIVHASCDNLAHHLAVAGLIVSATSAGDSAAIKTSDTVDFSGWSWASGPVLLGLNGDLTQTLPVGALFAQTVGRGDGTRLFLSLQPPILIQ